MMGSMGPRVASAECVMLACMPVCMPACLPACVHVCVGVCVCACIRTHLNDLGVVKVSPFPLSVLFLFVTMPKTCKTQKILTISPIIHLLR